MNSIISKKMSEVNFTNIVYKIKRKSCTIFNTILRMCRYHKVNECNKTKVNLLKPKMIWLVCIGNDHNLLWEDYNSIEVYSSSLELYVSEARSCAYKILDLVYEDIDIGSPERHVIEYLFNLLQELTECKKDIEELIKQYVVLINLIKDKCTKQISQISQQIYDNSSGAVWLTDLVWVYLRCGGSLPCTPYQMIKLFQEKIEEMSDADFFTVTHNIEYHLSTKNFKTIVQSFTHWLTVNKSALPTEMVECFFGI
jgi:hypothetical protein